MKCFTIFIIIYLIARTLTYGQSPDSLEAALDIAKGQDQYELLLDLFELYHNSNLDSAEYYANKTWELAKIEGDSLMILRALTAKGAFHENKGNYDSAVILFGKALEIARYNHNSHRIKFILNRLGMMHAEFGNYNGALENHLESIQLRKQHGDSSELWVSYNNIGLVYMRLSDFRHAIHYFNKSLAFIKNDDNSLAIYLSNMGAIYLDMDEYDSSLYYLNHLKEICKNGCSTHVESTLYNCLGIHLFEREHKLNEAKLFLKKSIQIGANNRSIIRQVVGLHNLSLVELKDNNIHVALNQSKKSLKLAMSRNYKAWVSSNFQQLANLYSRVKRYDSAFYFQIKYDSLSEILEGDRVRARIAAMERNVEKQEKILLQEREAQTLKSRNQLFISSSVGIIFLSGLAFFYYRSNRYRKRANKQIEKTLKELRATQEQLVAQEKMAALGQLVSGIAHEINTPLGAIQGLIPPVNDHFSFVTSQLNQGLKVVSEDHRTLILELMKHYGASKPHLTAQERRDQKKSLNMSLTNLGITLSKPTIAHLLDIGVTELNTSWEEILKLPNHEPVIKLIHSVVMHERGTSQMASVVNKIAKMVSALQTYSQPERSAEVKVAIDLRENIDQVLVLLENEFKKGVQLIKNYPKTLTPIQGNPEALSQVWTNLLINAIQAVEGEGTIEIEIEEEAQQITVSIKDDGYGINEEDKDKIFEAFYTTKKRGYGTGLGLNIARKVVSNHKGEIELKIKEGQTLFKTSLLKAPQAG